MIDLKQGDQSDLQPEALGFRVEGPLRLLDLELENLYTPLLCKSPRIALDSLTFSASQRPKLLNPSPSELL